MLEACLYLFSIYVCLHVCCVGCYSIFSIIVRWLEVLVGGL